jgi:flagellar hook-length control protein FliK
MDKVNAAEHSVRVQVETDGLGKVTADLHSRPGEIGVHLSVPDDAGRALMAQRMDALRDSLGQSGTAVHLSLAAQDQSSQSSQGQQGSTPREDRAPAQSAHQPHEAATPRATDGSPVTPAPADGNRLVDVRA